MAISRLKPSQLKPHIPARALSFQNTNQVEPLDAVIGQERAMRALDLGLELRFSGYNVFVTGLPGTGRTTIVGNKLRQVAAQKLVPDDWCFVYNFSEPDSPIALSLPAGKGAQFKNEMSQLMETLKREIQKAFSSDYYEDQRLTLIHRTEDRKREILEQLNQEARQMGLQIQMTPTGIQTIVLDREGKPLKPEEFEKLSQEEREAIHQRIHQLEDRIAEAVRALARLDMETQKSLTSLNERVAQFVVEQYIRELQEEYRDLPHVLRYLEAVSKDIINNISRFLSELQREQQKPAEASQAEAFFRRYQVNVVVDNSGLEGAPVVFETNPTYNNLIGRIEKYAVFGTYVTDFMHIKAGSLLRANGGYLIADAVQVLRHPFVYDALKRALRNRELRIEDVSELYGFMAATTLKPQPIPLNVKIVLIGSSLVYNILRQYDEEFSKIFKIRSDFDYETAISEESILNYARFIRKVADEEQLLAFDKNAVRELVFYAQRLVSDQEKLSLKFGTITEILQQANYWAAKNGHTQVTGQDVRQAVEEMEFRQRLVEDKLQEMIERDIQKINVTGEAVGEINGLAVYRIGDYTFGKPHRITAKAYLGNESVVHIERKARLSGKIHDKGVLVLSGFFNWKFGERIPLSFSASLTFEQNYALVDGDSASATELFALISCLSGVPIKQGIAVTGSVNQDGEIQPIGGVNQKIEGFFKVCQSKGLTGEQGVIIPRANVQHLVLKDEVQQAVRAKKFHIWAIDTVEDGLEILTGKKAGQRNARGEFPRGSIYYLLEKNLVDMARRTEAFRKKISGDSKKAPGRRKTKSEEENNEEQQSD
ncbi:MAG: ATP-binding protein [Calditrichaeota bacterium]|nr:MAG: ATP-binding protein [Calditrichota bacterium]